MSNIYKLQFPLITVFTSLILLFDFRYVSIDSYIQPNNLQVLIDNNK